MTAMIIEALSGWLAWALAGVAALVAVYIAGKRSARQRTIARNLQAYYKTREAIDNADISADAIHAVDLLRARNPNVR